MTTLAIIADSHFHASSRFDRCVEVHDWIASDVERRRPDVVLHAGDLFERASTPVERQAAASWLRRLADVAPVVLVRGNHDALGELPLLAMLAARYPILVCESSAVFAVAGIAIACLAWPRLGELARSGIEPLEAVRTVLRGLGAGVTESGLPSVLLAHAMLDVCTYPGEQPTVGADLPVSLDDLDLARCNLVALGHIHAHQSWHSQRGALVVYPGSPRHCTWGETGPKGYLVAEVSGHYASWEIVEIPQPRMLTFTARYRKSDEDICFDSASCNGLADVSGAEVRLRYSVSRDDREAAARCAEETRDGLLRGGALAVALEELLEHETAARAPEVATFRTTLEQLRALWRSRGEVEDPGVVAKMMELEGDRQ